MIKFQFDVDVDYFTLDPVAYAPALGETGMTGYRTRLAEIETDLEPRPNEAERWSSGHSHEWFTLGWNAQRLAVLDPDVDAIIATHARDRGVAAWLQDTAAALEEIGESDLAIDWARQSTEFDRGHQSQRAADYWCELLERHRPQEALEARLLVFRRWPSSATTAARLHQAAGPTWPNHHAEMVTTLAASPRDLVIFTLRTLNDVRDAWGVAILLGLSDDVTWGELVKAYEKIDPLAVLPVLRRLVDNELVAAKAQNYRSTARRLVKMRRLAAGTEQADTVDAWIGELRETHRRRPRLQQEFDRAKLP